MQAALTKKIKNFITQLYDVDKGIVHIPHFGLDHILDLEDLVTWAFPMSGNRGPLRLSPCPRARRSGGDGFSTSCKAPWLVVRHWGWRTTIQGCRCRTQAAWGLLRPQRPWPAQMRAPLFLNRLWEITEGIESEALQPLKVLKVRHLLQSKLGSDYHQLDEGSGWLLRLWPC